MDNELDETTSDSNSILLEHQELQYNNLVTNSSRVEDSMPSDEEDASTSAVSSDDLYQENHFNQNFHGHKGIVYPYQSSGLDLEPDYDEEDNNIDILENNDDIDIQPREGGIECADLYDFGTEQSCDEKSMFLNCAAIWVSYIHNCLMLCISRQKLTFIDQDLVVEPSALGVLIIVNRIHQDSLLQLIETLPPSDVHTPHLHIDCRDSPLFVQIQQAIEGIIETANDDYIEVLHCLLALEVLLVEGLYILCNECSLSHYSVAISSMDHHINVIHMYMVTRLQNRDICNLSYLFGQGLIKSVIWNLLRFSQQCLSNNLLTIESQLYLKLVVGETLKICCSTGVMQIDNLIEFLHIITVEFNENDALILSNVSVSILCKTISQHLSTLNVLQHSQLTDYLSSVLVYLVAIYEEHNKCPLSKNLVDSCKNNISSILRRSAEGTMNPRLCSLWKLMETILEKLDYVNEEITLYLCECRMQLIVNILDQTPDEGPPLILSSFIESLLYEINNVVIHNTGRMQFYTPSIMDYINMKMNKWNENAVQD